MPSALHRHEVCKGAYGRLPNRDGGTQQGWLPPNRDPFLKAVCNDCRILAVMDNCRAGPWCYGIPSRAVAALQAARYFWGLVWSWSRASFQEPPAGSS